MKLTMIDNAIDSLKIAMHSFHLSLDCSDDELNRLNKIIIIFLHNSIELLLKSILSQDDELSIYKLENNTTEKIIEDTKNLLKINPNKTLHEILIKDLEIQTISYTTLVDKYVQKYSCDKRIREILYKLGNYRNSITHFGLDISEQEDTFYISIYNTFDVILYELYDRLLEVDGYFSYNDVIDNLESWIEGGEDFLRNLCVENPKKKILIFTKMLKKTLFSDKLKAFLQAYNISIDFGKTVLIKNVSVSH